jgi:hypothetical protein
VRGVSRGGEASGVRGTYLSHSFMRSIYDFLVAIS